MTADEVIALRKFWDEYNYRSFLPEATVLASHDWVSYVQGMAALIPGGQMSFTWPTEAEANWSWPEGVTIVMEEPFVSHHTIISEDKQDVGVFGVSRKKTVEVPPRFEEQMTAGLVFGIGQLMTTRAVSRRRHDSPLSLGPGEQAPTSYEEGEDVYAIPILWIGTDPSDVISGTWIPGGSSVVFPETGGVSKSTRLTLAFITALGHPLTRSVEMPTRQRQERRRIQRELPSLRVLRLGSGASVRLSEAPGSVAWSHRWIVRGHWRQQAYGPRQTLSRLKWIDPFVKGPEDKPFDERRTLWKT